MKKILIIISTLILILSFSRVKADSWGGQLFTINNCNGGSCSMIVSAPTIYGVTNNMTTTKISESTFNTFNMTAPLNNNNVVQFLVYISGPNSPDLLPQTNISAYVTTNSGTSWCTSLTQSNQVGYYTLTCPILKNSTYLYQVAITTYYTWNKVISGILQTGISPYINMSFDSNAMIIQKQQETNEILNETTQYNTQTNTNTIGANETLEAGAMEDQLIQQNEFNGSILDGMTIDSNASGFIWTIMNGLRGMNVAIVSLMTMALGLGVIKLVLNR